MKYFMKYFRAKKFMKFYITSLGTSQSIIKQLLNSLNIIRH